jgi:hypothetical protein
MRKLFQYFDFPITSGLPTIQELIGSVNTPAFFRLYVSYAVQEYSRRQSIETKRSGPLGSSDTISERLGSLELQAQLKRDHAGRAITAQTDAEQAGRRRGRVSKRAKPGLGRRLSRNSG